ncbi:hypothetical protein COV83_03425 [Candidatus Peregrinibacteria bacterium CG11_big_fil_rev_8_21_14_0_20_49_14]|nr:MAG: hypothetical protein COV83_03425 [Candidatus Peregrinibacteria bacterium CG11_big_fil_rev_8_21_14_0_20_49_14]
MYHSILSALFLGLFPAVTPVVLPAQVMDISIAAPAERNVAIEDRISASGVVILDLESGQQLYGRQETVRRPMASITKLMTALIIAENHDMDEQVRIPDDIGTVKGNVVNLKSGETFTVGDLLSALLIASANDAAYTLALHHSATESSFIYDMNIRAEALGMKSTSFANASGLDHPRQWSTPQDIAWLTMFALKYPEIRGRMSTESDVVYSRQGSQVSLSHTHALLHAKNAVWGGKTGTTDAAGQCLVSLVKYEGREYVVVLLNSLQRYRDMNSILHAIAPSPIVTAARSSSI